MFVLFWSDKTQMQLLLTTLFFVFFFTKFQYAMPLVVSEQHMETNRSKCVVNFFGGT